MKNPHIVKHTHTHTHTRVRAHTHKFIFFASCLCDTAVCLKLNTFNILTFKYKQCCYC